VPTIEIHTTEMHTGGEPVRIIDRGFPDVLGATLLEKRRYVRDHLDHLRTGLLLEPRGHDDMYGALLVEPDHPRADLGVLFLHNEGYSTMCGHATIALGRFAVERGIVEVTVPETHMVIQCPCGPVDVWVAVDEHGRSSEVRFHSVDAFATALDLAVAVDGYGSVLADIAYGGAFYAFARASEFGLSVRNSAVSDLVRAATALTAALRSHEALTGTGDSDLDYLYGSILIDDSPATRDAPSANICVFADAQVDRSPTGSGVTARVALAIARNESGIGQRHFYESVLGTAMTGEAVAIGEGPGLGRVRVEVAGSAYFTGTGIFTWEDGDPLADGFRLV